MDEKPLTEHQARLLKIKERAEARGLVPAAPKSQPSPEAPAEPNLHPTSRTFVIDLVDASLKCDKESMVAPLYSLATRDDMQPFSWSSQDGSVSVSITPPVREPHEEVAPGRATIHDKDILIFLASQIVARLNAGDEIKDDDVIRFTASDFFAATGRKRQGGDSYIRLVNALTRLTRTFVRINYADTKKVPKYRQREDEGFPLLGWYRVVEGSPRSKREIVVEARLSTPFFQALKDRAVLTISGAYFGLRRPLARRLYEIARQSCGRQPSVTFGLDVLQRRAGSTDELRNFRLKLREIIAEDNIPDYTIALDADDVVTITPRLSTAPPKLGS